MSSEGPRFVDAGTLREVLPYAMAVDALEAAFRDLDPAAAPLRGHVETPAGTLLTMPAANDLGVGVKLVTLTPANPGRGLPFVQAAYVLFDGKTQAPVAVIDGTALTALRTAAVSGLATRHLAPPEASRLVVFGAGTQGAAHVESMRAVRPLEEVVVVSRTIEAAERLAERARDAGLRATVGTPASVGEADLVCTCTTSPTPVFDGRRLREGAHVNAVGAYTTEMRELDGAALADAGIVVETRAAALAEAGDLVLAFGDQAAERIDADLAEVVSGTRVGGHHTVFVSVGLAFEDLAVARAVLDHL